MTQPGMRFRVSWNAIMIIAIMVGLYVARQYNYLLFHILVEFFSIMIAAGTFIVARSLHTRTKENSYLLFISLGLLSAGLIDIIHIVAYKGMDIIIGSNANLPTQLWIAARYLQSAALLAAPLFLTRKLRFGFSFAIFSGAIILLLTTIFTGFFPDCFIVGYGLTPFKIVSEYIISGLLVGAIAFHYRQRKDLHPEALRWMILSMAAMIASEMAFTLYRDVYGLTNMLGHFLKVLAFWWLYWAVNTIGVVDPYDQVTADLRRSEENYRLIAENVNDVLWRMNPQTQRVTYVSPSIKKFLGYTPGEIYDLPLEKLPVPDFFTALQSAFERGFFSTADRPEADQDKIWEVRCFHKDGSLRWGESTFTTISSPDGSQSRMIGILRDVTERKRMEQILQIRSRLMEFAIGHSMNEFLQATLDEAEQLTGSLIGFFHFVDEDEQTIFGQTWSTDTLAHFCTIEDIPDHSPLNEAGVWADCVRQKGPVIHNDYPSLPDRKGMPPGHAHLDREMVIPILRHDRVVAVLGVGNKPSPYREDDIETVNLLVDLAWDIAERKQIEEQAAMQLRASGERYQTFIRQSTEGIYRMEMDPPIDISLPVETQVDLIYDNTTIGECNDAFARMYGVESAEELIGKRLVDMHSGKNNPTNRAEVRKFVVSGYRILGEETVEPTVDRGEVYLSNNTIGIVEDGMLVRSWGTQTDISESKHAMAALQESEALWRSLTQDAPDHILTLDMDLNITFANYVASGEPVSELIGKSIYTFIEYGNLEEIKAIHQSVLESGVQASYETQFSPLLPEGGMIYYETRVAPRFVDGKICGLTLSARDITEKQGAINALVESEERYQRMTSLANEIIYHLRLLPESKFEFVSPAATAIVGYTPEEHYENPDLGFKLVHPDDRHLLAGLTNCAGLEQPLILRWQHKDGRTIWVEQRNTGLYNQAGELEIIEGIARDITTRILAQQEVHKLSQGIEQSPSSIIIADIQGRIEYVNATLIKKTGYSAEEVLGKTPGFLQSETIPPISLQEIIEAGAVRYVEMRSFTKSGNHFWERAVISPLMDESGNITHYIAVKEDITETKLAEAALNESQKRLHAVLSGAPMLLFAVNCDGKTTFAEGRNLSGRPGGLSSLVGQRVSDLFPGDPNIQEGIGMALAGSEYDTAKQFSGKWFNYRISPLPDEHGAIAGAIGVLLDISERKAMEQMLSESQKMANIGVLSAAVMHEIKSPLQIITGVSESMQRQISRGNHDPEDLSRRLEMINRNGWRINKIAVSLLNYARATGEEAEVYDLNEIVEDTLVLIGHSLTTWSDVTIHTELGNGRLPLICERNKISQILINLLTNAKDAMPAGGEITIRTGQDQGRQETFLQVADTGAGIPAEIQEKIFAPFYTTKPVGAGTGLGLSIVTDIVREYGGHITLKSQPGQGTVFIMWFPTSSEELEDQGG
jgi:PAS domain S-box-containing protein